MSDSTTSPAELAEIPFNAYRFRCVKCEKGKSREKGTPMLIQTFEFAGNKPININGNEIDINGLQIQAWAVYTEKALGVFNAQRKALGLIPLKVSELDSFDEKQYLGAEGAATAKTTSKEQKNDVTGETIINPNTGKPMMSYRREIVQWCER